MIEPMSQPGAFREFVKTSPAGTTIDARGHGGDQAVLCQESDRESGCGVERQKPTSWRRSRSRLRWRLTSTPLTETCRGRENQVRQRDAAACSCRSPKARKEPRCRPEPLQDPRPLTPRSSRRRSSSTRLRRAGRASSLAGSSLIRCELSFETKRLHRTDAHGIDCRVKRAGNAGKQSQQEHHQHERRVDGCIDVSVKRGNQLERIEQTGSKTARAMHRTGSDRGLAEDHASDLRCENHSRGGWRSRESA